MSTGWPSTVRIGNSNYNYIERDNDVYYEPEHGERNSYAYISIHNPSDHFLRWDGGYWTKAHKSRNKFISLQFFRGTVSYPRTWSDNSMYRLETDPDNAGEWRGTYERAKLLGALFWSRIALKQSEAQTQYVNELLHGR